MFLKYQKNLMSEQFLSNLLINPKTQQQLDRFYNHVSHAVLLTGAKGMGLSTIAEAIISSLMPQKFNESNIIRILPNEKESISIDAVRELRQQLKLRNDSSDIISKAVVIDAIDAMQHEAQNALLKMLEEPPHGVLFVILSHDPSRLLGTISSRCSPITVLPVSFTQANEFFNGDATLKKNYAISGGAAGLLCQLMQAVENPLILQINLAKGVLSASLYERLILIEKELKAKDTTALFLDAMHRVCIAGLEAAINKKQWLHNTSAVATAQAAYKANVQNKLILDNLFLNLH